MSVVVIADDETAIRETLSEVVAFLGHEAVLARDGEEALRLVRSRTPDLVITDHLMPRKTGVEVIRALRDDPRLSAVPVLLISAARPIAADEAWRFVPKPCTLADLERHIREGIGAFRRTAAASSARVTGAREEMLKWVSHELRSPLGAATLACELARRGLDRGEAQERTRERVEGILRQLRRMEALTRDVLDAARLDEEGAESTPVDADLGTIASAMVAARRGAHRGHDVELTVNAAAPVSVDPGRVRQIAGQLLSNALKYASEGPVRVAVDASAGCATFTVTDDGPGIAAEDVPRFFDRFVCTARGGGGHGLGLHVAAALARTQGGALSVATEVGRGSSFTLSLPLRRRGPP